MFPRTVSLVTTGVLRRPREFLKADGSVSGPLGCFRPAGAVTFIRLCDTVPGRRFATPSGTGPPPPAGIHRFRRLSQNTQMPKKAVKGQPSGGGGGGRGVEAGAGASGPVTRDKNGGVSISVHVKPGSKHSGITDVSADAVGVAVAAPPTDGEANAELIRYLAEVLDIKKSHISLEKGSRSREKVIGVASPLTPEEVLRRLRQATS